MQTNRKNRFTDTIYILHRSEIFVNIHSVYILFTFCLHSVYILKFFLFRSVKVFFTFVPIFTKNQSIRRLLRENGVFTPCGAMLPQTRLRLSAQTMCGGERPSRSSQLDLFVRSCLSNCLPFLSVAPLPTNILQAKSLREPCFSPPRDVLFAF